MGYWPSRWLMARVIAPIPAPLSKGKARPADTVEGGPRHDIAIQVNHLAVLDDINPETVEPANHRAVAFDPFRAGNSFACAAGDRVGIALALGIFHRRPVDQS